MRPGIGRSASCTVGDLVASRPAFFHEDVYITCYTFGFSVNDSFPPPLTCRHLGQLRTETFSVRLHGGRWGRYAFVLSGNLLKLFVNCREVYRRLVPLPDFCANDSSLVVTIADSAEHSEEYITGLYVSHGRAVFEYIVCCNFTMHKKCNINR